MRFIIAAAVILAASWVPLLIVGLLDPTSNPIGLGLLGMAGTFIAAMLGGFHFLLRLWHWMTD